VFERGSPEWLEADADSQPLQVSKLDETKRGWGSV
jgi:hypothetical protein